MAILDARITLHSPDCDRASLPKPILRPYPSQYIQRKMLQDGTPVTLRPVLPTDESLLRTFYQLPLTSGMASVDADYPHVSYFRLHEASEQITRLCFLDYEQDIVLVAECQNSTPERPEIKGVGRLSKLSDGATGQLALVVDSDSGDRGLGIVLLQQLIHIGRQEGLHILIADVWDNPTLSTLFQQAGFVSRGRETGTLALSIF
ncbi:MAG: GNAT family N-acetyltransferase [Leptolyngbyaceae bacterium]|nr:GNAT family N-acetyltransferase [Leptolyngbyaceae bacterium]